MANELKAAFFDVDWTLYDHKAKRYVASGIEAIKELKHKGVKVFICSARPYESLRLFGVFDQGVKWDGFIACAGAYAVVGGKTIRKLSMPKGQVRTLVNLANRHGLVIQLVTPRTRFLTAARNEYVDSYESRFHDDVYKVHPYYGEDVVGMLLFAPEEYDAEFISAWPGTSVFRFDKYGVDIYDVEHVKGEAISDVLAHLEIPKCQSIGFGDDVQDASMKGVVGTFVCMGNGKPEVKEQADYVTSRIDEDGVREALRHFGYID